MQIGPHSRNPVFQYGRVYLLVGLCVNLDAASLMVIVIVCKSSFLLISMFTSVNEYVCIIILSLVSLAFSSATRMAVI